MIKYKLIAFLLFIFASPSNSQEIESKNNNERFENKINAARLIADNICWKETRFFGTEELRETIFNDMKKTLNINEEDLSDKQVIEVGKNIAKEYNGKCFLRPSSFYRKHLIFKKSCVYSTNL